MIAIHRTVDPNAFSDRNHLTVLRVFLASPSDVTEERRRLQTVLNELNSHGGLAEQQGLILRLLAWETAYSGMGRPEDVILDQMPIEQWDIFVGLLWTRFGLPSGGRDSDTGLPYDSGTEEEFRLAYRAWKETGRPHILFYRRNSLPREADAIDPVQLGRVQAFFREFGPDGKNPGLFTSYMSPSAFERRVRQDLTSLLPKIVESRRIPVKLPSGKYKVQPKDLNILASILAAYPMFQTPSGRNTVLAISGISRYVEIDLNGSSLSVASSLVVALNEFGEIGPDDTALGRLLIYVLSSSALPPLDKHAIMTIASNYGIKLS